MSSKTDTEWLRETEPIPYQPNETDDGSSLFDEMKLQPTVRSKMSSRLRRAILPLLGGKRESNHFHFGIITPVFDGALQSLKLLRHDLISQYHTDWTWMLCSNGYSSVIAKFAQRKSQLTRGRVVTYTYLEHEPTPDPVSLLSNVAKRRDYCIDTIDADVIFTIDADAKIIDREMFSTIDSELYKTKKRICIYRILFDASPTKTLPIFPITFARIDSLNFCVEAKVAKAVGYPTGGSVSLFGNEFHYLYRAYQFCNREYLFINRVFAEHNGNRHYENLLNLRLQGDAAA